MGDMCPAIGGGRIVGGQEAAEGEFSFMAMITFGGGYMCGASLIAPDWLLTAAHCTVDDMGQAFPADTFSALMGTNSIFGGSGEQFSINEVYPHPNYDAGTMEHDIALLHLTRAAEYPTINFRDAAMNEHQDCATCAGWGTLSSGGDISEDLMKVGLAIVDNEACNDAYGGQVHDSNICAADQGQDSCQGDSGGPLFVADPAGNLVQTGVVSWGYGCAEPEYPGIYTRVSSYVDWINGFVPAPEN